MADTNIHTKFHNKNEDGRSPEIEGYIRQSFEFALARWKKFDPSLDRSYFLDIGCDYGFAAELAETSTEFADVAGYDPYLPEPQRSVCGEVLNLVHGGPHEFIGSSTYAELGSKPPSAIFMNHVLEHIPDLHSEWEFISKNLAAPGTNLFIAVPEANSPWALWEGHYTIWTPEWLDRFMSMHGWASCGGFEKRCFRGVNVEIWNTYRKL